MMRMLDGRIGCAIATQAIATKPDHHVLVVIGLSAVTNSDGGYPHILFGSHLRSESNRFKNEGRRREVIDVLELSLRSASELWLVGR